MAVNFDASEFVDQDMDKIHSAPTDAGANAGMVQRAPTREEVDTRLTDLQTRLAKLKSEQNEIERERSVHEETRRRQNEFDTGREEMIRDLSRGVQILEETEINTRREVEQMARTLGDLKTSLSRLREINKEGWTRENLSSELSRALGSVDHARMEWNSARLRFAVLSPEAVARAAAHEAEKAKPVRSLHELSFLELSKLGLFFTWPVLVGALAIVIALLVHR